MLLTRQRQQPHHAAGGSVVEAEITRGGRPAQRHPAGNQDEDALDAVILPGQADAGGKVDPGSRGQGLVDAVDEDLGEFILAHLEHAQQVRAVEALVLALLGGSDRDGIEASALHPFGDIRGDEPGQRLARRRDHHERLKAPRIDRPGQVVVLSLLGEHDVQGIGEAGIPVERRKGGGDVHALGVHQDQRNLDVRMHVQVLERRVGIVEQPHHGVVSDGGRDVVDGGSRADDQHLHRSHSSPTVVQNQGMTRESSAAPRMPMTAPVSAMSFS